MERPEIEPLLQGELENKCVTSSAITVVPWQSYRSAMSLQGYVSQCHFLFAYRI